jgi:hypothetical protein
MSKEKIVIRPKPLIYQFYDHSSSMHYSPTYNPIKLLAIRYLTVIAKQESYAVLHIQLISVIMFVFPMLASKRQSKATTVIKEYN